MVDDHVAEEENNHDEIGLWGVNLINCFDEDEKRVGREGLREYPYLSILMKLWTGYWNNHTKRMNMKVGKENGK